MAKGFKDGKGKFHATSTGTGHGDKFKLLAETSGKMGIKKEEFAMFAGKVVTPTEKIKLEEQKALKEKGKKK